MHIIEWREEMSVGNKHLDNEHKQIINMINELGEAMQEGKSGKIIHMIIDEMVSYTFMHFRNEEIIFSSSAYPHVAKHKEKHAILVEKVNALHEQVKNGKMVLGISILNFLKDWLTEHIMKTDKTYAAYM